MRLHAGYYTKKSWVPLPLKIKTNFYLSFFSNVKKDWMLPGGFLGLDVNGTGGIIVVPFNKSANQFQKVFASPNYPTSNFTFRKQLEALRAEQ